MKKIVSAFIVVLMLMVLGGCGSSSQKGEAASIGLVSGGWFYDVNYEILNEGVVRITDPDTGDVVIVATSNIKEINVRTN